MRLLDRTGAIPDPFVAVGPGGPMPEAGDVLVAWADLPAALASPSNRRRLGIAVPNHVRAAEIAPHLADLALIAVAFPSFSDGRGFSIACQLRRLGFSGRLRASGPLIADQFAYALACGFDEVAMPDELAARQPVEHWLAALGQISGAYQRGYGPGSILDRRRAAAGRAP
jgi:uncharacterized protein (DUF934 family)